MKETFERIAEHLYKRQYQTAGRQWKTIFYGIFTDWKSKRRKFPLGGDLSAAKDGLSIRLAENVKKVDFDGARQEREKAKIKAMTLAEWLDRYLDLVKHMASSATKSSQCIHLKRLLGHHPLSEITRVRIMEYKSRRLAESLIRYGEPVEGTKIKGATANREVSCLVAALNLAATEGLCGEPPRITKEREIPRERILTDAEYKAIVDASPRWLQRVVIAANETAIDRSVLLGLTWDEIKPDLIAVKGGRAKTGVRQRVGISPELAEVLDELRAEYRRLPNTDRRVFTKTGKPIPRFTLRRAFDKAVSDAKIEDFQLRDFRHCARTRWAASGLPYEVAEGAMGHSLPGLLGRYTNLTDDHIREAFRKVFPRCSQENQSASGGKREGGVSA